MNNVLTNYHKGVPTMTVKNEHKIVVRIDAELYEDFKKFCEKHDVKMSQVVRAGIRNYVNESKKYR